MELRPLTRFLGRLSYGVCLCALVVTVSVGPIAYLMDNETTIVKKQIDRLGDEVPTRYVKASCTPSSSSYSFQGLERNAFPSLTICRFPGSRVDSRDSVRRLNETMMKEGYRKAFEQIYYTNVRTYQVNTISCTYYNRQKKNIFLRCLTSSSK